MSLNLIVVSGFYPAARHAVAYADQLAQALHGSVVLLHVNRASVFDPYEMMGEKYRQEELSRQTDTAAALYQQAEALHAPATVEVSTDLLPKLAQDLAKRHRPACFVLGQSGASKLDEGSLTEACEELLRAGQHAMLVVPATAPLELPRRILVAADAEPFTLAPNARPIAQQLPQLGSVVTVVHVSEGVEDDAGCAAALRAVQASGLVAGLPTPELRGYTHDDHALGLLAAVQDTQPDLVLVLARPRGYLSELFHRSITSRLLERCPVPVLVLPTMVS
ncbi:Nucleotide-binding universal stress protein, UspA family [Hymenobacter gelipurpurascens]|uniref:Nucleotide-binding universal stress protein, UspA family n=1 Tax=Hymenobacter gelipurpurascens TaxID=89968 RepID=A0A212TKK4_9BACT|nr:universal stress protein [Hymenobacter gelipurpurascens]SNC66532.1 Nucleotide-binding universal stress protein, UspA family [Hymenobacter gelipurpurascens]